MIKFKNNLKEKSFSHLIKIPTIYCYTKNGI